MKLKRIKLLNEEKYSLCILEEEKWISFDAILNATKNNCDDSYMKLKKVSDDLIGFLEKREELEPILFELIEKAKENDIDLIAIGQDVLPYRPLTYRDFMLYEGHAINSYRGFTRVLDPEGFKEIEKYETETGKNHPKFIPNHVWYNKTTFYKGNVMSFKADNEDIIFPDYATMKDYELELGMIMTKEIKDATEEEALDAIGAFCILNDFSARNVQLEEMTETMFGPCKCKDFASSLSTIVVTADEFLPKIDEYGVRVIINDKLIVKQKLNIMYHSLGKCAAYASKGETVYPGEFLATGTVSNCCGIENGTLLNSGDVIRLEIDGIGTLTNSIV